MVFHGERWGYFLVFWLVNRNYFLIFLFIVSLISSFNSYGSWTEIPQINSDGQTSFIDFDRLEEKKDGYVYWWMMTSSTKTSEKIYIQTDCDSDRINSLQVDLYSNPMGFGEVDQIQPEEGWVYPSKDSGLYRFVKVVCDMARVSPEERQQSVTNLLMSLEYKKKINELSEEEGIINSF